MHSMRPNKPLLSPESALASEIFDQFVTASTFKSILNLHRQMCETLRIKPSSFPGFYVKLKSKLRSWKAASLWSKLDKRASHKCYNRGRAASGSRVLIIGAGPVGLRTAIEAQLLGAKVVVIEKRDKFSRNNVLHLWPFVIHDLRSLGAKKFYGKFCAGSIDHISIRQVQCILLKVALLIGVEVHESVGFVTLIEPPLDQTGEKIGWRASVEPSEHPVSQYEFGVLIGADGKRNTLSGFKKKEFRGKLAIAITANLINKRTLEEARIEEISGVAFIFNQKFFHDLREATDIDLENIVYYKDETHYFVMTAKKQSLIYKGVILNDYPDTVKLLSPENVDREALMAYAREAADFSTKYKFPHMDFAVNHYGQPDIAMFDFTSMYAAENASQVVERRGYKLLMGLVGDTLLEPFWPTGSGCARGFLSAFDAAWMIRSLYSGKLSVLQVLAERECVYRLLGQTTPENLSKDFNSYTLNPSSRYPNLNVQKVQPGAVKLLYDSDVPISEHPKEIVIPSIPIEENLTSSKKKRKDSEMNVEMLLAWCQRQVRLYDVQINDMSISWKNGRALGSILHRYRPDLIDVESMTDSTIEQNNKIVFGIFEKEYNIFPIMSGKEMAECNHPDEFGIVTYVSQVYDLFKGEIPYVVRNTRETSPENEPPSVTPSRKSSNVSRAGQSSRLSSRSSSKRQSLEQLSASSDSMKRSKPYGSSKRRSVDRNKMAQLFALQEQKSSEASRKSIKMNVDPEKFKNRCKDLEDKIRVDFGMITREERRTIEEEAWKKKKPHMPIGKIEQGQWNVKMLEEKLKALREGKKVEKERKFHVDGSRITQDVFDNKLKKIDVKLKSNGRDVEGDRKYDKFDEKMKFMEKKLRMGPDLDTGQRGNNKVAIMASKLAKPTDDLPVCIPPISKSSSSKSVYLGLGVHGSEVCYFCQQRVYLMERMSAEGLFFHRGCFKCEYCGTSLRLGGYAFDRTRQFGGKFYCQAHFGMQKIEKPKSRLSYKSVTDGASPTRTGQSSSILSSPNNPGGISPRKAHLDVMANLISRGLTPERAEFENSYADFTTEDELSELDEDEWTERNFGSSFEQDTSDDEYSELSTDSDSDISLEEEVERSMTVDETRRLAERWKRRYSQDTLVDVDGSTDEEIVSDTETDVDGDSVVFSSDEDQDFNVRNALDRSHEKANHSPHTPDRKLSNKPIPIDFSSSDNYSTYSETEDETPPVKHEIPDIVIQESTCKVLGSDEEHLVPEAVEVFHSSSSVYDKEKIAQRSPSKEKIVQNPDIDHCDQKSDFNASDHKEVKNSEEIVHTKAVKAVEANPSTIFIKTVTGPPLKSHLGMLKSKFRDDERRHTSPVSIRDITRAKEEFLKCGGDMKKRTDSPVKKDALFKTLQSIEQLQRVLESPPLYDGKKFGSGDGIDIMQRTSRSMSPVKTPAPSILSRFRTTAYDRLATTPEDNKPSRSYILSKTASTSCVPSQKSITPIITSPFHPVKLSLCKISSTSDIPSKPLVLESEKKMERLNRSDLMEQKPSPLNHTSSVVKLEPVMEDRAVIETKKDGLLSEVVKDSVKQDILKKEVELPMQPNLLSPTYKRNNDIMLDSESMSSTSTLNEEDFVSYKIKEAPVEKNIVKSENSNLLAAKVVSSEKSSIDLEYDRDADEFSGSDWAHDELVSACEDDLEYDLGFDNRFVTTRKKFGKPLGRPSYEMDFFDEPDNLCHAPSVQPVKSDNGQSLPFTPVAKFMESDFEDITPVVESLPFKYSPVKSKNEDKCVETPIVHTKPASKSLEYLKNTNTSLSVAASSDESLYQTPDANMNTKYGGYTGNFAKKVSPFGSILDSVLKKNNESSSRDPVHKTTNGKVDAKFCDNKKKIENISSVPDINKENRKNLKLNLKDFECFGSDKRLARRRSLNEGTPITSKNDEKFFTPATSRKKYVEQRPWSVYGTPTETRKVVFPLESTPNNDANGEDFRQLTTVERDKLRNEARRRARLKSDEELGLTPSFYHRKYSSRKESFSDKEAITEKSLDKGGDKNICDTKDKSNGISTDEFLKTIAKPLDPIPLKIESPAKSVGKPQEATSTYSNMGWKVEPLKPEKHLDHFDKSSAAKNQEMNKPEVNVKNNFSRDIKEKEAMNDSGSHDSAVDDYGSRSGTLERLTKKRVKSKKESADGNEEEKPIKRKSFFAMLSLVKSPENQKKPEKVKESSPANVSCDSSPSTTKNGKERSFLKRLNRSKEKFREKKRECDRGEALVPSISTSTDDVATPVTVVEDGNKINSSSLAKSGPPQASDDSFTESEGNSVRYALSSEQLLNQTDLTEKVVTESLLGDKRTTKDKDQLERQEKLQKIALKVQKQQEWKRHRLAQEIQRNLEELDVKRRHLERQGVELEKALRLQDSKKDKDSQVMNDWLNMIHQKNKLNNEEQNLLLQLKELQLEDRHSKLQKELRSRMSVDDSMKSKAEIDEERDILKEMLKIVEEKDALVEVLEDNRKRHENIEKDFLFMMKSKRKKSPT